MKPFSFNTTINNADEFQLKLLNWAHTFNVCALFNSNQYPNYPYAKNDFILAVNAIETLEGNKGNPWQQIEKQLKANPNWWYGYLTYDLKNYTEDLSSENTDLIQFPDYFFFVPKWIFKIKDNEVFIYSDRPIHEEIINEINLTAINKQKNEDIYLKERMSKTTYLEKLDQILEHIRKGDIYEVNFCQEFFETQKGINPIQTYVDLNTISKAPFSCFLKIDQKYLISSSPERFLKKEGNKIISQPIKGTAKRSSNPLEDQEIKLQLQQSLKDTTENIMIVDLVRNDLSKTSIPGTVKVEELNQVYSFEQVHQLISTISSQVDEQTHPIEVIKHAFPMGSMTGAPKVMAMELIEQYEESKRGLYSGAVGYFDPKGNFDFNVIIRSIMHDAESKNTSVQVGGAITYDSDPEQEYEECLIKISAMKQVLEAQDRKPEKMSL